MHLPASCFLLSSCCVFNSLFRSTMRESICLSSSSLTSSNCDCIVDQKNTINGCIFCFKIGLQFIKFPNHCRLLQFILIFVHISNEHGCNIKTKASGVQSPQPLQNILYHEYVSIKRSRSKVTITFLQRVSHNVFSQRLSHNGYLVPLPLQIRLYNVDLNVTIYA